MTTPAFTVRDASRHDLGVMADNLEHGFETYRGWARSGWEPPSRTEMLLGMMQRFTRDGSWAVVAFTAEGDAAGHAAARPEPAEGSSRVEGVARLTHLFVRRHLWGSGIADELHDRILAGMRERGFGTARLWTPAGQARARAFYERRGWRVTGATDPDSDLGLELVEYELRLAGS